jgi:hypothetical protein
MKNPKQISAGVAKLVSIKQDHNQELWVGVKNFKAKLPKKEIAVSLRDQAKKIFLKLKPAKNQ